MENETMKAMIPEIVELKKDGVVFDEVYHKAVKDDRESNGCNECSLATRCGKRHGMTAPCLLFGRNYHFELMKKK